ncbi:hypothetical protein Dda_1413 [Drechslerella dactyloides]|uniref:Uncharacterized protein n=1 Tax=Drechslerella dactyloides TaxID=74499 RepID=A0AAD6NKL0_DREDA|nr:hypothetical protein Dda_1413 [Drechslerella dactyloides]
MASLADSINSIVPATADLRKASVDQHRAKNRKMRYRNVNVNLLGQPIYGHPPVPECQRWNDRNKFKMPDPNAQSCGDNCRCPFCRGYRWESSSRSKARSARAAANWDNDNPLVDSLDASEQDNIFRDGVDGVLYSYDRPTGPSHGSQILAQALNVAIDKLEKKQLDILIKNEYDIVDSEESASSEDDEYEFV